MKQLFTKRWPSTTSGWCWNTGAYNANITTYPFSSNCWPKPITWARPRGFLFYAPAAITAVTFFTDWRPEFDDALWYTRLAAWWFGAAGLWFLVRLGFYRGTRGDNKYGPARR